MDRVFKCAVYEVYGSACSMIEIEDKQQMQRQAVQGRGTCHEVQEGEALKVLGLLVAELHYLVVALPQSFYAQAVPGVLVINLLQSHQFKQSSDLLLQTFKNLTPLCLSSTYSQYMQKQHSSGCCILHHEKNYAGHTDSLGGRARPLNTLDSRKGLLE